MRFSHLFKQNRFAVYAATAFCGVSFLAGCGSSNPFDRSPSHSDSGNKAFSTSLNNAQLKANGTSVLYRFKSIANAVILKNNAMASRLNSLSSQSETLLDGKDTAKKVFQFDRSDDLEKPDSEVLGEEDAANPFFDARFDKALKDIRSHGITLKPTRVALIDSGVRSSTPFIKNILANTTNLTLDADETKWQPHATAIASLFSGILPWAFESKPFDTNQAVNSYAPNTQLFSFKIAFNNIGRVEEIDPNYGNYQLAVAIDQAVASGARVVNMSFTYSPVGLEKDVLDTERMLLANAQSKGVIFVSAAGNSDTDLDKVEVLPARFDLENIVTVGSHTRSLRKANSSSFGENVELTAQGDRVPVNDSSGKKVFYSGTSFAAPMVCAALSLYFGILPQATFSQALYDLYASTRPGYEVEVSNREVVSRYGKLDAEALVKLAIKRRL